MWDRDDRQSFDTGEVSWITGVQGNVIRECDRGDHGVKRPGGGLATRSAQRRRDPSECASRIRIEWKRVEIRFRLLNMGDSNRALSFLRCDQRTDRKFCEGYRRDHGLRRQAGRVQSA
jgi:hypothetical protein